MEILGTMLFFLAVTVFVGWLVSRWERRRSTGLTPTQIDNLNDAARRMRAQRADLIEEFSDKQMATAERTRKYGQGADPGDGQP